MFWKGHMEPLGVGNTAKIYCLNWIEKNLLLANQREISILDLGCGDGGAFVGLLRRYSRVRYVGVEPITQSFLRAQENLNGLRATVVNAYAYAVHETLGEQFDIVISFSTFEHVYRRRDYLRAAKESLKPNGHMMVNYDAGHFQNPSMTGMLKNMLRPILARWGIERYYQRFVKEQDFVRLVGEMGLTIVDAKFFNAYSLKGFIKVVPEERRLDYLRHWLQFELQLNETGVDYADGLANIFATRNFILTHGS